MIWAAIRIGIAASLWLWVAGVGEAVAAPTIVVKGRLAIRDVAAWGVRQEGAAQTVLTGRTADADLNQAVGGVALNLAMSCNGWPWGESRVTVSESGRWAATIPLCRGRLRVTAKLDGNPAYTLVAPRVFRLDVRKHHVGLQIDAPRAVRVDGEPFEVAVQVFEETLTAGDRSAADVAARVSAGDVSRVPVKEKTVHLHIIRESGRKTTRKADTDHKGAVRFALRPQDLGKPGTVRLTARTQATRMLDKGEESVELELYVQPQLTLVLRRRKASADERVTVRGSLTALGQPLPNGRVQLRVAGRTRAAVKTDAKGSYRARLSLRGVKAGRVRVAARYVPAVTWRRTAVARPVVLEVTAVAPLPAVFYFVPVLLTAIFVGALVGLRKKPWKRWLNALRKRKAHKVREGIRLGRTRISGILGVARRVVSGRVVEGWTGGPLAGVTVELRAESVSRSTAPGGGGLHADVAAEGKAGDIGQPESAADPQRVYRAQTDGQGRFGPLELTDGAYRLRFLKDGYVSQSVDVQIPHRGTLEGLRVRMISVRQRVMELYLDKMGALADWRKLFGVWTAREMLEHLHRRWPRPIKEADRLTDIVEETVYAPRIPHMAVVAEVRRLLSTLPAVEAPPPRSARVVAGKMEERQRR